MPLLLLPLVILLALAALIALVPLALVQRYRIGMSRQRARGWLATINLVGLALSGLVLISSAAVTTIWVPWTLTYAAVGLGTGASLGVVGLWLTRWEPLGDVLYYTPNRLLVLAVMLVVAGRLLYGVCSDGNAGAPASRERRGSVPPAWRDRWPPARSWSAIT